MYLVYPGGAGPEYFAQTSHDQIDQARHAFILRLAFHHWRNALASRKAKHENAVVLDDERRIWAFFGYWRKRSREKQQTRWRNDMRSKMKVIKDRQVLRILRDAWALWHQNYQLHSADQQYRQRVLLLAFLKWKEIFHRIDSIEGRAEQLTAFRNQRLLFRSWETWRATASIASAERDMVGRVHARIIWNAWRTWKKRTYVVSNMPCREWINNAFSSYDYRRATFFRGRSLQREALSKWKNTLQRVHVSFTLLSRLASLSVGMIDTRSTSRQARCSTRQNLCLCCTSRMVGTRPWPGSGSPTGQEASTSIMGDLERVCNPECETGPCV